MTIALTDVDVEASAQATTDLSRGVFVAIVAQFPAFKLQALTAGVPFTMPSAGGGLLTGPAKKDMCPRIITRSPAVPALASGTINSGDSLTVDTTTARLGSIRTAASGEIVIGMALTAGLDGQMFLMKLDP